MCKKEVSNFCVLRLSQHFLKITFILLIFNVFNAFLEVLDISFVSCALRSADTLVSSLDLLCHLSPALLLIFISNCTRITEHLLSSLDQLSTCLTELMSAASFSLHCCHISSVICL